MNGTFADSLLAVERSHLLIMSAFASLSFLAGGILLAWSWRARLSRALPFAYGQVSLLSAVITLSFTAWAQAHLALRDYPAAVALRDSVYVGLFIDGGSAAVGVALVLAAGRRSGHERAALLGYGLGALSQGVALGALDLVLRHRLAMMW